MAFNGSGVHNRVHDWTQDLTNTIPVTASRMDAEHDDMSSSLSNTICRDGQSTTTARIPFASGVSTAAGTTSSVAYAQSNDTNTGMYFPGTDQWGLAAGGAATLTSTATKLTAAVAVDFTGAAAPTSSDGAALGATSQMWSDLFLASGAVINWNNGDVTLTHSANALAFAGGTVTFDTAPTPASSDGAALGTSSVMWSDLFLASGAVINFNNGDVTLTHSADMLTIAGGTLAAAAITATSVTSSNGLTVSGGSVNFPDGSIADADLASPGRMKLIHAQTASSSATIDFNQSNSAAAFDGTYKRLMVIMANVKAATDDVELWLRVGTGGTPTYQTSGYSYANTAIAPGLEDLPSSSSATRIIVAGATNANRSIGNGTGEKYGGTLYFDSPEASDIMPVWYEGGYISGDGLWHQMNGSGAYMTAGAITAIRFLMESGNIASGTFALYGIKNS